MPRKRDTPQNTAKRNFLGPKKRSGSGRTGRDPARTPAQQDDYAAALKLGRSALGKSVQRAIEALDAVKPLYLKDGEGFAPMEDVPDHAIRMRAADYFADRFGIPKKVETGGDDPFAAMMAAVAMALKESAND